MHVVAPALLCWTAGLALVCAGWSRQTSLASDLLLKLSLAAGCGFGLFSIIFFLCLTLSFSRLILADAAVLGLLLASLLWIRLRHASGSMAKATNRGPAGGLRLALAGSFAVSLFVSLYASVARIRANPHGIGWDAFAIWNLRARFLYRGGPNWKDGLTSVIAWSHPDYPLLLPAGIANFWRYLGSDSPIIPGTVALIFTFSTVGLLFSGLSALRGRSQGFLGGLVLMGTPFFVERGSSQYADVPLGFFFLATTVLLCLQDDPARRSPGLIAMSGVTAGFAAWTKNEGLLFLSAVVLARLVLLVRRDLSSWKQQLGPMFAGVLPFLLLIGYFKLRAAPAGEMFSDVHSIFDKLSEPSRYWATTRWFGKELLQFGHWWLVPGTVLLAAYYFLVGKEASGVRGSGVRTSTIALGFTLAGYFAIYLITPYDIYWHLRFSLNRLFLQLWPSAIFLFFMMTRTPEQATRNT